MNRVNLRSFYVGIALALIAPCAIATSHIFVSTEEGVWLVSDSLAFHGDGTHDSASNRCKVAISRGRFLFNAGSFSDLSLLMQREAALPAASMPQTMQSVERLLMSSHVATSRDPDYSPDRISAIGIVQEANGVFQAHIIEQTEGLKWGASYVLTFAIGIPYGLGDKVDRLREEARNDPSVAARIAKNPKQELIKVLREEAAVPSNMVGAPFTVLLMHNDGTVSDFSDQPLCSIPHDALHVEASKPTAVQSPSK